MHPHITVFWVLHIDTDARVPFGWGIRCAQHHLAAHAEMGQERGAGADDGQPEELAAPTRCCEFGADELRDEVFGRAVVSAD